MGLAIHVLRGTWGLTVWVLLSVVLFKVRLRLMLSVLRRRMIVGGFGNLFSEELRDL